MYQAQHNDITTTCQPYITPIRDTFPSELEVSKAKLAPIIDPLSLKLSQCLDLTLVPYTASETKGQERS